MLPASLHTLFRDSQYTRKTDWNHVALEHLTAFCNGAVSGRGFESGKQGVWLRPVFTDADGGQWCWLLLDVESSANHDDIGLNLAAGRSFLRLLIENDLAEALVIFLSGRGLRFCWPYLVAPEIEKAFRLWMSESEVLDTKPFNGFYRMFANRCHKNQGVILNRHVHRLDSIDDLWSLDEAGYLSLCGGCVDLKTSLTWLAEIAPASEIPDTWKNFLRAYQVRTSLKDTIFSPVFPATRFKRPVRFLAEQAGFEFR